MDWKNKPNQIFNKVKQQMYGKGIQTFYFFDQHIQAFDPQDTRALPSHFFNLLLNRAGVFLTIQEIRTIKDLYAKQAGQDLILYRDFLEDVKYSMTEKIAGLIGQAFSCLDRNNEGAVSLQTIINCYNQSQHPHCLTRRKAPQDVKNQFISAIRRKADSNGLVTKEAFVDYYAELNFCVPAQRESFFEQLIVNTWNLKNPQDYVSEKRIRELEHTLYEKIRLKSDGKTNQWKAGRKALAYFDLEDQKKCGYEQFKKGLDKFGCNFKEHEMRALFQKYADGGYLDYQTFSKFIMDLDINGMVTQPNLLQTKMGTNHFKVTH